MVVKHWNEVSEQVVGLTSLKYFKSRDKYSSKMMWGKKLANQFITRISIKCYSGETQKNIQHDPFT